jgi:hypothetical protein
VAFRGDSSWLRWLALLQWILYFLISKTAWIIK